MNRRFFLTGLAAGICAPTIIRPGILMPVKPVKPVLTAHTISGPSYIISLQGEVFRWLDPFLMDQAGKIVHSTLWHGQKYRHGDFILNFQPSARPS